MASLDPAAALALLATLDGSVRVPGAGDKVYKDECMFSFTTPEDPQGVYVNLTTFQAFSAEFLPADMARTGGRLYLHQRWKRVKKISGPEAADGSDDPAGGSGDAPAAKRAKPTKLAIGVEGGVPLDEEQWEYEKTHTLVVMPENARVPFPSEGVPASIAAVAQAVIDREDASKVASAQAWEGEKRRVSKYAADLPMAEAKKIPTSGWVCEESGRTDNLWLNLSDGHIGSGRKNWDGSGGTGAALDHFKATGSKYPLVVKLGTITPHGADVYSYAPDEDDMVEDPHLAEHLARWGINMMSMEKTEKTMEELELDLNMSFEWDKLTEAGKELVSLRGPGLVGLNNLGNSCYFNSVMQSLFAVPKFAQKYLDRSVDAFTAAGADPALDLNAQMCKLAIGLLTDKYVVAADARAAAEAAAAAELGDSAAAGEGGGSAGAGAGAGAAPGAGKSDADKGLVAVAPRMLKTLLGSEHTEFSTNRQQDAAEYFGHVLERIHRAERASESKGADDPTRHFKFKLETRLQDGQSGKVRYSTGAEEHSLMLSLPLEAATNAAEVAAYEARVAERAALPVEKRGPAEEPVRLRIPFEAVLNRLVGDSVMDDYTSPVTNARGTATKRVRFANFPDCLMIALQKYVVGADWRPKKLDTLIDMPEELDLSAYRGTGLREGEEELPDDGGAGEAAAAPEPDAAIVASITGMGFSENAAKRAALAVSNAGAEEASNWVMMHMEDADLNDPLPAPGGAAVAAGADPASVEMLSAMGISDGHARLALRETGGDLERAAEWAFSHPDNGGMELDAPAAAPDELPDGSGKYELLAIISHMGTSVSSGHYVAHIKKDGKWVFFNDRKVAESQTTPIDMGYMYLYKRKADA